MDFIRTLAEIGPQDRDLVGGKALGLARLAQAGFAVPQAFCITTLAHESWQDHDRQIQAHLAETILEARAGLQCLELAVRSSLTIEDSAPTSLAGLAPTRIGRMSGPELLETIMAAWNEIESGPIRAYLSQLGLAQGRLAAALVVQVLVRADVAGVLMTKNPVQSTGSQFVVEAAWGLGESVVAGLVLPDRYYLDPTSGNIIDAQPGFKPIRHSVTGVEVVPESAQRTYCLTQEELTDLAAKGRAIEALFGWPCDIEWARAANTTWLLQARPITANSRAEQARVRLEEIEGARIRADRHGTIWFRNAFAQELPEPTPMTWSVLKTLLSSTGAFGRMYRSLGFRPDPVLEESGSYDLICGRLYCNLSREPLFYADGLPLAYDFDALHRESAQIADAQPKLDWQRADARFWFGLPSRFYRSITAQRHLRRACATFPEAFHSQIVPTFDQALAKVERFDWTQLDQRELHAALHHWINETLYNFGAEAVKAGVLAIHLSTALKQRLTRLYDLTKTNNVMRELVDDLQLDAECDVAAGLRDAASGVIDRASFLARFGHRGGNEWELAQPSWGETPEVVADLLNQTKLLPKLAASKGGPELSAELMQQAAAVRQLLALRELGKHYLLRGYAVIRRILLEWDRRLDLNGGIFYLKLADLDPPFRNLDLQTQSARARRHQRIKLGLPAPAVLFSDDLEAIGRPCPARSTNESILRGTSLSSGEAEGIAFIPNDPRHEKPPSEPYVLVCAHTDPAWIPLVGQAQALVTETGGLLSHGAILARELGVPAVGGIDEARQRLAGKRRIRVDGTSGLVTISS
ncbi:PEP/pyruvate-binding domain-containing protein [soil metagenome]